MSIALHKTRPRYMKLAGQSAGISLLEMMVTPIIVMLVMGVVLSLFNNVSRQRERYFARLERQAKIENCMSRMIEEIAMMGDNGELKIVQDQQGWQVASHLTIEYRNPNEQDGNVVRTIEWISAPRYTQQDLVLFRREKRQGSQENDYYVPLCDGLYSFDVRMIDAAGETLSTFSASDESGALFNEADESDMALESTAYDDPNNDAESTDDPNDATEVKIEAQPVVEIVAEMYQFEYAGAENVQTYRRTFCLKRF